MGGAGRKGAKRRRQEGWAPVPCGGSRLQERRRAGGMGGGAPCSRGPAGTVWRVGWAPRAGPGPIPCRPLPWPPIVPALPWPPTVPALAWPPTVWRVDCGDEDEGLAEEGGERGHLEVQHPQLPATPASQPAPRIGHSVQRLQLPAPHKPPNHSVSQPHSSPPHHSIGQPHSCPPHQRRTCPAPRVSSRPASAARAERT